MSSGSEEDSKNDGAGCIDAAEYYVSTGLAKADLESQAKSIGVCFDPELLNHFCLWDPKFPENPKRLNATVQRCKELELWDKCQQIPCRAATETELTECHTLSYIESMKSTATMNEEQLKEVSCKYDGVYLHQESYNAACMSAGACIDVMNQLHDETIKHGMTFTRPPGHHAMRDRACGYCIFNNAALAAKHAINNLKAKRVLIIDWDVHHGQGTQQMFYEDSRVLYFSIHRYEHGAFWPNLQESNYDSIGTGSGVGHNINVPLNQTGATDSDYMAILHQLLMPVAYEYNPDFVIISAGYDSVIGCPEGLSNVTPSLFTHWVNHLKVFADGKLCVIMEGGYCVKSLAESAALTLRTLLDESCPALEGLKEPSESVVSSILHVIQELSPHWDCFYYQSASVEDPDIFSRHVAPLNIPFDTEETRPDCYELVGDYIIHTPEQELYWDDKVQNVIDNTVLRKFEHRTCLVYDENMRAHKCTSSAGHPERPDRISRIYNKLQTCGLVERCHPVQSRLATKEELLLVHSEAHVDTVSSYQNMDTAELHSIESSLMSVYLSQEAYNCALLAAGSTLNVVDEVCTGKSRNGVAVVRPPGHHAEQKSSCGFCFFNNVAIAAKYAQKQHHLKKILIVDWDVHHGNGIQNMFEGDSSILYISLHRYNIFPMSGDAFDVGKDDGEGFTVNIPWLRCGTGDAEYLAAFHQVILPIAYQFAPDLVLVSAGFDAARGDPLGGFCITPEGYGNMTQLLCGLADGNVILVLEGGYNLISISESLAMCTSVLLGDQCPRLNIEGPNSSAVATLQEVIGIQKRYWSAFQFLVGLPVVLRNKEPIEEEETACASGTTTSQIEAITNDLVKVNIAMPPGHDQTEMSLYQVAPLTWCPHLTGVERVPACGLDVKGLCEDCDNRGENWICLVCYKVYCSRYVNEHMVMHGIEHNHLLALSFSDLSVWCYGCDAYVHNEVLLPAKRSAHLSKFGEDIPGV